MCVSVYLLFGKALQQNGVTHILTLYAHTPFFCQPFMSRLMGGGDRGTREIHREFEKERESVSSFTCWKTAKDILYRLVFGWNRECISTNREPDLPVCCSVHLLTDVSSSAHRSVCKTPRFTPMKTDNQIQTMVINAGIS